jgi:hypothetical protein
MKEGRLRKNYPKLTQLERFRLMAEALKRRDDDDLYWLRMTCPKASYVGPEPAFSSLWEGALGAGAAAYSWWTENETALLMISKSVYFVETMKVQGRDLASEYYCQGYKAAWRDAGRSEEELEDTHDCINDCDACTDRCDEPPAKGIYTFSDLEKHDPLIYKAAKMGFLTDIETYISSMQGLYIALERLAYVHDITLRDLLATNPAFQYSIKKWRQFLTLEIDPESHGRVTQEAEVYFAVLEAIWNRDSDCQLSAIIEAVYGPKAAAAYEEMTESFDLSDWDDVKLFHPDSIEARKDGSGRNAS